MMTVVRKLFAPDFYAKSGVKFLAVASFFLGGCILQSQKRPADYLTTMQSDPSYDALIGEPLSPRKNYDIERELQVFFNCKTCLASADPASIKKIIEKSTKSNFFTWVLRSDGLLVLGEGPDEFMSHGVLATLNMKDQKSSKGPIGHAYAGGEGYLDRHSRALFLSNKSGHYRPEFSRVKNSVTISLFTPYVPKDWTIQFVDQTKPPKPVPSIGPGSDEVY